MKVEFLLKDELIYRPKILIDNPIISIILPTYCRGNNGLLERAIKSVINQTFRSWELIIVDDGSVDNTRQIVEEFMRKDNRIIYIRNGFNTGLPAVRVAQGMLHSRGKYIAYQFDDDQWYDNMLQDLYEEIIKYNELVVVYGKGKFINLVTKSEGVLGRVFDKRIIEKGNIIPNNGVLHNKELLNIYGTYDCNIIFRKLSDWDLWRRWSKKVPMIFVDKYVSIIESRYRDSLSNNSNNNRHLIDYIQEIERGKILSLNNIKEYEVDSVDFILDREIKIKIYKEEILKWYKDHNLNIKYPNK